MEVTTVSPSPASPTEGADLCETDVTNVAIHSVTLLICLCGLAGNGAVLCLLSLENRNSGIFDVALADFLFLLFMVPSAFLFLVEDVSCSPIMPLAYVSFLFQLSVVSFYWVLHRLTPITVVFHMFNVYQLCRRCDPLKRLFLVVVCVQDLAFFALFTLIPTLSFLCPSHEQGQCRAALISIYTITLILLVVPTVIPRIILRIRASCGSQQQKPKSRDIAISLVVHFTLLLIMCNFLQQLGYFRLSTHFFFLLTCIHSSIKPFIYFLAGRCWSPCSMGSLWLSLLCVFEEKKEITSHSDDVHWDMGVSVC